MSAIAADVPRSKRPSTLSWSLGGLLLMVMLIIASVKTEPVDNDSGGTDPGDGSLANGENRCDELGSFCVGTWSGQATGYIYTGDLGGMYAENPAVNTSKIIRGAYNPTYANRATFYNSGGTGGQGFSLQTNCYSGAPSPVRCLRILLTGGTHDTEAVNYNSFVGRVGVRFYVRLNAGFQSTGDGTCNNDKYQQFGDYMSGFSGDFRTSVDSTSMSPQIGPDDVPTVWLRMEAYMDNWQNPTTYSTYIKRLDTGVTSVLVQNARIANEPGARESMFPFHFYRAASSGSCSGNRDTMFALFANWPAGGSGRIYGAHEVEGSDYLDP